MVEDKKISDAVHLLLKGGKMLGFHCQNCETPVFDMDGNIFCPHCGKRYNITEKDGKMIVESVDDIPDQPEESAELPVLQKFESQGYPSDKLELLFNKIATKAASSDNIHEIKELVGLLREIAEIIKLLKD